MPSSKPRPIAGFLAVLCLIAMAGPLWAAVPPGSSPLAEKSYRHADLTIEPLSQRPDELPPQAAARAQQALAELGASAAHARVDLRSERLEAALPAWALLPGKGNDLQWDDLGIAPPAHGAAHGEAAWQAFAAFLAARSQALGIDSQELSPGKNVVVHRDGELVQLYVPRVVDGIPVRGSYLTAVVSHGNLVLMGAHQWGDVKRSNRRVLPLEEAVTAAEEYLHPFRVSGFWSKPQQVLLPVARGHQREQVEVGRGYDHRLVWSLGPRFVGDLGQWEILVDAHTAEVIAFEDTLQHATRKVMGGVLPVSNDGIVPDGIEQPGWPMPFDNVATPGGTVTTDAGGNLPNPVTGTITSNLDGAFVRMNDACGAISLSAATGDIDFGVSPGGDCSTPGFGGPGNTRSSRTGFYELNRIKEMARGQLPANTWLQQQLTSNVNFPQTCNAFWNGVTVNFYRSGGGCANTGELAGVIDHEWGHGMDDNDAVPSISNPGEGIADVYAALRLNTSCIGRGFRVSQCSGYGDPCINCTGIRDIDWALRVSGQPHDLGWINANCGGGPAPCGGIVHCEGAVYAEAVWDLYTRDLQGAPYNMDDNTALEATTRLTYLGAGGVGTWYQCTPPFGGCSASGGYLNYLAADDDNGNINDGTPHMTAIFNAFNRHQIACATPTVQDSGCPGAPTTAPVVTATPLDKSVQLSWGAVAGATEYQVFRTDGVFACDFGKIKAGETTQTTFTDTGLQNGRDYSYVVIPVGGADTCMGPASSCVTVAPVPGFNLDVLPDTAVLTLLTGDGDDFLDNCETAQMSFDVANSGVGTQNNVRIVGVTPTSHPSITVTTAFPAPVSPSTLPEGAIGTGSFDFTAEGLSFNDTVTFQVDVTSDELSPIVKSGTLVVTAAESDFVGFNTKTFSFEIDLEDWQVAQGTFNRSGTLGGGNGTLFAVESSNGADGACDRIHSPLLRLQSASTMSLANNYEIEPQSGGTWYDRANVGILDDAGARTLVTPDGGRLYNADSSGPGTYTGCNEPEEGWAGTAATWGSSSWTSTALQAGGFAGQTVQLEVVYATDGALALRGFSFDEVTLTDVDVQSGDAQSDVCSGGCDQGRTEGSWSLPFTSLVGSASGKLIDANNVSVYGFRARLLSTSSTGGSIVGTLSDGTSPDPDYDVIGTYTITSPPGKGRWQAEIFNVGTTTNPVGKMDGGFEDDPLSSTPGTYKGDWEICP